MSVILGSTIVDVDLDRIVSNMAAVRAHAKADVIAVVKADGYGHGAEGVGRVLADAGAVMLAVSSVEEALVLRRSGIVTPILILLGVANRAEADAAVGAGCTVAVWDEARAAMLADAARAARTTVDVHFKVDTGLSRLGASAVDALARHRAIAAQDVLRVEGVYTHLATDDDPDDTVARRQLALFSDLVAALPERPRWIHALASAGAVTLGDAPGMNAVRVGLALYGLDKVPRLAGTIALSPALSWRTRILRVADRPAGTGVGYGHTYHLPRAGRIATLPVGYGDGLPRTAGRGAHALVRGQLVPMVGRISMDLTTVDVSDVPGVADGDEVTLIGRQEGRAQSANDLAEACGTIAYEILTGIRERVPRRYLRGERVVSMRTMLDGYVRQ